MSEITVLVSARAKPGHGAELLDMYGELAAATHREQGCLAFTLHRGLEDHDVIALVERWESKEALDAHLQSSHVTAFRRDAAELADGPSAIVIAQPVPAGDEAKGLLAGR
jgi:quinol monooxygenase YgiN